MRFVMLMRFAIRYAVRHASSYASCFVRDARVVVVGGTVDSVESGTGDSVNLRLKMHLDYSPRIECSYPKPRGTRHFQRKR